MNGHRRLSALGGRFSALVLAAGIIAACSGDTGGSAGLSEPIYPASEIRAGHTGTALLLLEILPNGWVGQVRLEQSSGFGKLDQSAMREARKWRFVPGTRDGIPVTLWKQVPIKFELHDRP